MPWFRLYAEAVDDEKLRLLAFEDRWHFTALLCCKGQGILPEDGAKATDLVRRKVAVKLGLDLRAFEEAVRRLAEVGLIDQESLQPLAWEKRQARSDADPTAADRQRRYRKRQAGEPDGQEVPPAAGASSDDNGDVTRDKRVMPSVTSQDSHGSVTGTEVEVEEEGDKDSVPPSGDTGGEPPIDPAVMTKEQLWSASKSMLAAADMPAKQCGAFVGALVSRYGEDVAKEALRAALLARPADPASYLTAACQHASGKRKPVAIGRQQALESNNHAVAARLAAAAGG